MDDRERLCRMVVPWLHVALPNGAKTPYDFLISILRVLFTEPIRLTVRSTREHTYVLPFGHRFENFCFSAALMTSVERKALYVLIASSNFTFRRHSVIITEGERTHSEFAFDGVFESSFQRVRVVQAIAKQTLLDARKKDRLLSAQLIWLKASRSLTPEQGREQVDATVRSVLPAPRPSAPPFGDVNSENPGRS